MLPPRPLGRHLIAEFAGCRGAADPDFVRAALVEAAHSAGATVLKTNIHHFGQGQGVTGVVLLAESHISIHTWPEHDGYAAIDVFMCGDADINAALAHLRDAFAPHTETTRVLTRGAPAAKPAAALNELAAL